MNHFQPVLQGRQIRSQDEIQRVVAKPFEGRDRRRIVQDQWMIVCCLQQQLAGTFGIRAISQTDVDHNAIDFVGQRPIQQPTRDELLVGNDVLLAIPIRNGCRPDAVLGHNAGDVVYRDDIADSYPSFEQNEQASNKVC